MSPNGYFSRWNTPGLYQKAPDVRLPIFTDDFRYIPFETAVYQKPSVWLNEDQVNEYIANGTLDLLSVHIVCRVLASKYVTLPILQSYMLLQGACKAPDEVSRRLGLLLSGGFLRKIVCNIGSQTVLEAYMVGNIGNLLGRAAGVPLHRGICYLSVKKRLELGLQAIDSPEDIKKVLQANQTLLQYIKCGVKMERFGFLETLRLPDGGSCSDLIARTTSTIYMDSKNILLLEIVRSGPEWQHGLCNKVSRLNRMLAHPDFLAQNNIGAEGYPQLLFCCENEDHCRQIYELFRSKGIFKECNTFTPLFTYDQLTADCPARVFSFGEDGRQTLYDLPAE